MRDTQDGGRRSSPTIASAPPRLLEFKLGRTLHRAFPSARLAARTTAPGRSAAVNPAVNSGMISSRKSVHSQQEKGGNGRPRPSNPCGEAPHFGAVVSADARNGLAVGDIEPAQLGGATPRSVFQRSISDRSGKALARSSPIHSERKAISSVISSRADSVHAVCVRPLRLRTAIR